MNKFHIDIDSLDNRRLIIKFQDFLLKPVFVCVYIHICVCVCCMFKVSVFFTRAGWPGLLSSLPALTIACAPVPDRAKHAVGPVPYSTAFL